MFSLFKKSSPSIPYTDKVWKKEEYAVKGMVMMALMRLQKEKPCLLVTFFPSETERLKEFMQSHQLGFIQLDETVSASQPNSSLYLAQADVLNKTAVASFLKLHAEKFSHEAIFSSHYPVSGLEDVTLQNLMANGLNKFIFCLSFDDPLLKIFNSQNIVSLLEKLGLEEEESIEHSLVTQSIRRAREKVESKVSREIQAKSPEEWFALNLKK